MKTDPARTNPKSARVPLVARFGAVAWPRRKFLLELHRQLRAPTRRGSWA